MNLAIFNGLTLEDALVALVLVVLVIIVVNWLFSVSRR